MSVSRQDVEKSLLRVAPEIFDLILHLIETITHSPDPEASAKRALLEAGHDRATQESIRQILHKRAKR